MSSKIVFLSKPTVKPLKGKLRVPGDKSMSHRRLQPELAADHVQLVGLSPVDVVLPVGEIAAGIDHPFIQEEPVEGVGNIVMIGDVPPVLLPLPVIVSVFLAPA